jgi:hypothetical protein
MSDSSYKGLNFHCNSHDGEGIKESYFIFHSRVFSWFLNLVNESKFIGYIITYLQDS